ncbi:MAG: acylphosphatase [Thaumarchaeota archaeon]|nr:acylphosphatase [Nitrososphaerota archaeon]
MTSVAVRLKVDGLVHGVFFRATMASLASDKGVSGWVRNLADGSVEAMLEGEEDSVNTVVEWARRGPPRARVDAVRVEKASVRKLRGFRIVG